MGESWDAFKVKCPFYRDHGKNRIRCEGLVTESDAGSTVLTFPSVDGRKQHMVCLCRRRYKECALYKAILDTKYPEEA